MKKDRHDHRGSPRQMAHRAYAHALLEGTLGEAWERPAETIRRYTAMALRAAAADRAYVYLISRDTGLFEPFIEETSGDVGSRVQGFIEGADARRATFESDLRDQRFLTIVDRSALEETDPIVFRQLGLMNVASVIIAAVRVRDDVLGFVGFDNCRGPHVWSEDEQLMLQMLAEVVSDHIHRGGDQITLATDRALLDQMQRMSRMCGFSTRADSDAFVWYADPRDVFGPGVPKTFEALCGSMAERSAERLAHAWRMAHAQGIPFGMDITIPAHGAEPARYLHVRGRAERVDDGATEIRGAFQDISARVQQEAVTRRSLERHRLVFRNARDAIVIADAASGELLEVNQAAEHLWGLPASQLVGRSYAELHPPARREIDQTHFESHQQNVEASFETEILRGDGSRLPVEVRSTQLEWTEGRRAVIGFFRDIRDRERARRVMRMRVRILRSIATDASLATVAQECAILAELNCDGVAARIRLAEAALSSPPDEATTWSRPASLPGAPEPDPTARLATRILLTHRGEEMGDLLIYAAGGVVTPEVEGAADEIVQLMQVAFDRIETLDELRDKAERDALTGQFNRAYVADFLSRTLPGPQEERALAALVIDVDDFKEINDTLGHAAGDAVIRTIAHRLAAQIPDEAVFGRWGGDEFVAILPDELIDDAERIADMCLREVEAAIRIDGATIFVTLSIGIAFRQFGETSWEPMLQRADTAMYLAKKAGRNRYRVFDDMLESAPKTSFRTLHRTLEGLLEDGHLDLLVRPRRLLEGRAFSGARVLGAWRRAEQDTLIDPQRILPDAAQRARFDRAVLEATLEQLAETPDDEGARLTIQLGAQSFADLGRLDTMLSAIGNVRGAARQLELSIEAVALGDDFEQGARNCDRIRNSLPDIRLAIHRVGAGNTPLAGLLHLPVNIFELDEGLIEPLPDDPIGPELAVIRAYGTLARTAKRNLRAPSIDRSSLVGLLAESGVREGYGRVIGDLVPWERFVREASS